MGLSIISTFFLWRHWRRLQPLGVPPPPEGIESGKRNHLHYNFSGGTKLSQEIRGSCAQGKMLPPLPTTVLGKKIHFKKYVAFSILKVCQEAPSILKII